MCIGCGYCASLFQGRMSINTRGFLEPIGIDEKKIDICPGINLVRKQSLAKECDPLWGRIEMLFAGHAVDQKTRFICSSGGGISAILIYLLDNNLIDSVVHTTADDSIPYANKLTISSTAEEVISASGSRYAPSSPLSNIFDLAKSNKRYAFVGKPCDIYALSKAKENNVSLKNTFPFLISFMCGGLPSLAGAKAVARNMGVRECNIKSYRYRGYGCPGFLTIETVAGNTYKETYHSAWGKTLNRFLHLRCKVCADGIGEFADIVCADFWLTDNNGFPIFEESEGMNLFVARTVSGKSILEQCLNHGTIKLTSSVKVTDIKQLQPFQYYRKTTVFARILSLRLIKRCAPVYKGMNLFILKHFNLFSQIKSVIGMFMKRNNHRKISYYDD